MQKKKKESSTKVAKLTDGKKIIRKKIKIDQNNRKVEKITIEEIKDILLLDPRGAGLDLMLWEEKFEKLKKSNIQIY